MLYVVVRLAYPELVGGVLSMRVQHFQRLNGYSNLYWGWGAEDDDMAYRCVSDVPCSARACVLAWH